ALLAWARAERLILAGDPCQLPPTVVSPEAERQGLGISLFERLLETHADVGLMLREQYRMHETLIRFPSDVMYGGALRAAPAIATHTLADVLPAGADLDALDVPPLVFVDTAGMGFDEEKPESVLSFQGSLCNRGEADIILRRVEELVGAGLTPAELGVIAPYRAQARHLREALAEHLPEVEVDTVDAFQGREKDAILLTLTRSNDAGSLGFLTDRRRMNVALTRARRHLFIVGDSGTVGADPFFERLLAHVEAAAGYRSGWAWRAAPA
ncbi:MAG TPA: AAA domain-containing protein, partial [Myxococcota bacterium]|nr:AAA domain-containing protein [Myxococcota bacterium]